MNSLNSLHEMALVLFVALLIHTANHPELKNEPSALVVFSLTMVAVIAAEVVRLLKRE